LNLTSVAMEPLSCQTVGFGYSQQPLSLAPAM